VYPVDGIVVNFFEGILIILPIFKTNGGVF
jgi:hypothetical protein